MSTDTKSIVERAASLLQKPKFLDKLDLATRIAGEAVHGIELLRADEALMTRIAQELTYRPQTWSFCRPDSDWYSDVMADIKDVYPALGDKAVILVSLTHRWTLVGVGDHVLPFIFLTKGGSTRLYRLVLADAVRWLPVLGEQMGVILRHNKHATGSDEELTAVSGPVRDPKWDVTGLHL